jgi:hypothetical protein
LCRNLYFGDVWKHVRGSESHRTRHYVSITIMKVEKEKFDNALARLLKAKPEPRKKIKTTGRRGSKAPILSKP